MNQKGLKMKTFKGFINEVKQKIPAEESLDVTGISPNELARAETIGAMTYLMKEFTEQKVSPMHGGTFALTLKNGVLFVIWTREGKRMLRVRTEQNPSYYNNALNVFKKAYKKYSENKKIEKEN